MAGRMQGMNTDNLVAIGMLPLRLSLRVSMTSGESHGRRATAST
jgi:hypothetical protein